MMAEEKKDNKSISPDDPRMPFPARRSASRYKLPAGLDRITVMMGFLFFVGIAWVFWETHAASPQSAQAENKNSAVMVQAGLMDMKLLALEGGGKDETDKIIAAVYQNVAERQIPWADLKVNPFVTFGSEEYSEEIQDVPSEAKTTDELSEETPAEIVAPPVDKMQLQSVLMMGDVSSATISGVLVTKGQVVGGWKVVEIHPTKVVLQWRDQKCVLDMSQ